MTEKRLLYFALGALTVVSVGAMGIGDDRIIFSDGTEQVTAAPADPRRGYYVTSTFHDGAAAPTACAGGYHMASMFEILDPTALRYDAALGATNDDSGSGPPTFVSGWIRTGSFGATEQVNVNFKGDGGLRNCDAYASNDSSHDGTVVWFNKCWQEGVDCTIPAAWEQTLAPWWLASDNACDAATVRVWCVEDSPGSGTV